MRRTLAALLALGGLALGGVACSNAGAPAAAGGGDPVATTLREAALAAARVWRPPSVPIAAADLGSNPHIEGGFSEHEARTNQPLEELIEGPESIRI